MVNVTSNSKQIQKLLERGYRKCDIVKMGYSKSTVRYWHRKMYQPEVFKRMIDKLKDYQMKKYAQRKTNSNH